VRRRRWARRITMGPCHRGISTFADSRRCRWAETLISGTDLNDLKAPHQRASTTPTTGAPVPPKLALPPLAKRHRFVRRSCRRPSATPPPGPYTRSARLGASRRTWGGSSRPRSADRKPAGTRRPRTPTSTVQGIGSRNCEHGIVVHVGDRCRRPRRVEGRHHQRRGAQSALQSKRSRLSPLHRRDPRAEAGELGPLERKRPGDLRPVPEQLGADAREGGSRHLHVLALLTPRLQAQREQDGEHDHPGFEHQPPEGQTVGFSERFSTGCTPDLTFIRFMGGRLRLTPADDTRPESAVKEHHLTGEMVTRGYQVTLRSAVCGDARSGSADREHQAEQKEGRLRRSDSKGAKSPTRRVTSRPEGFGGKVLRPGSNVTERTRCSGRRPPR